MGMKKKNETEVVVNDAETPIPPTVETPAPPATDTATQPTVESSWKKKCAVAKDYVSNSFKSKEKADQEQNIEKCTKSKTSFWKSPAVSCNINGTTVDNIKSNIMKVTKKKKNPPKMGGKIKKKKKKKKK